MANELKEKKEKKPREKKVIISRAFSYKMGRPNYSSADFHCSITQECPIAEAGLVGAQLDKYCVDEVKISIGNFLTAEAQKNKKPEVMTKEEVRVAGAEGMLDFDNVEADHVPEIPEIENQ